jgi:acyl-CoA thioesterase-1
MVLAVAVDAGALGDPAGHAPFAADKNILFFGNSLTAGYGLDPGLAFPGLIQEKIDRAGLDYQVINAGLSGETSAGGLARIDWVLSRPVDVFVLELGANDGLRGLPLDQTRENLRRIIEKVQARNPGVRVVVAGMMVPPNMGEDYSDRFVQMYPDLAAEYDAALIPFLLEGVGGDPQLNLADGIHPNAEGHRIVAETVWKALEPVL